MGVQGLWDLLSPVGRRISVETLSGKRLAIDASIWMIQFMKAMRDEKGEMTRNAHLLGFFRRICKLLFLRTRPVFVFDGGTPALKRRTVIARRRQRDNAQAKIRKTAEKLFLNQFKKLKELEDALEKQKLKKDAKGEKVMLDQADTLEKNDVIPESCNQEKIDEMLAATLAAEEHSPFIAGVSTSTHATGNFDSTASTSAAAGPLTLDDEDEDDEEVMILATETTINSSWLPWLEGGRGWGDRILQSGKQNAAFDLLVSVAYCKGVKYTKNTQPCSSKPPDQQCIAVYCF